MQYNMPDEKKKKMNENMQNNFMYVVKNYQRIIDLSREEEHMYWKPTIMNTSCSSAALRHGHRAAITSGRLTALALCLLFHIPVWFVLTALPVLQ